MFFNHLLLAVGGRPVRHSSGPAPGGPFVRACRAPAPAPGGRGADRPRPTPRRTPRQEAVADADPGAGCVAPCRPTKRASNQPLTATHRTPGGSRTPDAFRTVGSHVRCHWPTRRSTTCRASISCPGAQLPVVVLHCVGVRVDPRLLLAPPDRGYLRHEALRPRGPVAPWPRRQPPGRPPRRRPAAVPGPAAARVPVRPVREHRVDQGEQPLRFPGVGRAHRKDVFSVASSSRRMTWSAWGAREFCGVPDLPRTPVVAAAGLHVQPAAPGCPDPSQPFGHGVLVVGTTIGGRGSWPTPPAPAKVRRRAAVYEMPSRAVRPRAARLACGAPHVVPPWRRYGPRKALRAWLALREAGPPVPGRRRVPSCPPPPAPDGNLLSRRLHHLRRQCTSRRWRR